MDEGVGRTLRVEGQPSSLGLKDGAGGKKEQDWRQEAHHSRAIWWDLSHFKEVDFQDLEMNEAHGDPRFCFCECQGL